MFTILAPSNQKAHNSEDCEMIPLEAVGKLRGRLTLSVRRCLCLDVCLECREDLKVLEDCGEPYAMERVPFLLLGKWDRREAAKS